MRRVWRERRRKELSLGPTATGPGEGGLETLRSNPRGVEPLTHLGAGRSCLGLAEFDCGPGEVRLDWHIGSVSNLGPGPWFRSCLCEPRGVAWGQSLSLSGPRFPHLRSMTLANLSSWFWPGKDLIS